MALYFLSYDLRKSRNYQPLYDELGRIGAVRVLESLWSFARDLTSAESLSTHYRQFVDADDGLIVIKASDWAGYNLLAVPPTPTNWT
ncbi:hypothetical protein HMPREF3069_03155 [Achromobacter xylosoxidans]|uniref:hypothetical protein n=1 Tax=Alcaligenes xylosoxydans xylosoxydans TaxID=85698 RepID=UPI0006BF9D1E|nr:hypothetical protein [Achromobacter xylosoxidans]OFL33521.1 hypothetical protein HMPREF2772_07280 [Achromobacter xylosoxidans]OFS65065.1 hypothetical protein HMPREF3069_03155 [Achromobacter xylosoxidans]CUJ64811.1 Uncharacterised protein [Achromobacter xylosoxidans]